LNFLFIPSITATSIMPTLYRNESKRPVIHLHPLTPGEITSEDTQHIFDAGWDEQAFLESVCLCAITNCMNRFVMGIGADAVGISA